MANFTNKGTHEEADSYMIQGIVVSRDPLGAITSTLKIDVSIGKYSDAYDPISGHRLFDEFSRNTALNVISIGHFVEAMQYGILEGKITLGDLNQMIIDLFTIDEALRYYSERIMNMCDTIGISTFPPRVERTKL